MKKLVSLFIVSMLAMSFSKAQVSVNTATDFTVTDLHGNTFNLFSVLNQGKHVVIDFFFTTCGPCQAVSPKYKQAFQNYGCNTGNVVFISIDKGDNNSQCQAYENTYVGAGGPPMFSGIEGGGNAVCSAYGPSAFPTMILIAPNKTILEKDMWPINAASDFDAYLSKAGLTYSACSTGINEVASPFHFSLFPNPAADIINVTSLNGATLNSYNVMDPSGRVLLSSEGIHAEQIQVNLQALAAGFYLIEIQTSEGRLVRRFNKE